MRRRIVALASALVLAAAPVALAGPSGSVTATVRVQPLVVTLALEPSTANVGASIQARSTITNNSESSSLAVRVELRLDPVGVVVKSSAGHDALTIRPGRNVSAKWTLCGRTPGSYVVLARVTVGDTEVESPARLLTIRPNPKGSCK